MRGSVKLFSIDQSERAYCNHHTGSDVTRFWDDFLPPFTTKRGYMSFFRFLFFSSPSPCFRSYTRLYYRCKPKGHLLCDRIEEKKLVV